MDYSGGWMPGMAPHIIDLPIWALDLKYPTNVSCSGGRYVIDDDGDAPDVQEVLWQYPEMTVARIWLEGKPYVSKGFREGEWRLEQKFDTIDNRKGSIEVYYLKKFPKLDEGPFLKAVA